MGFGGRQKQDFRKTLALCPQCKEYMSAVSCCSQVLGKKYSKALPVKYCVRCKIVLVLDRDLPVSYQIKSTHDEAKKELGLFQLNRKSRTKEYKIEKVGNYVPHA